MKQKIFLIIGIFILTICWIEIFNAFMANHTYYNQMLANWANWKMFVWALISAWIAIYYITSTKKFSLKRLIIRILPIWLLIFAIAHTIIKESIVWWTTWFLILCLNNLLLYALWIYFIVWISSLWTRISNKRIKFKQTRRQEMILNFWIWLSIFLLLIYILSMVCGLFWIVSWIIFIWLGFMIKLMKKELLNYKEIIENLFSWFHKYELKQNKIKRIWIILIWVSIMYFFYWFQLSFVPYSTAWDANHEYMYTPKVIAENHGVLRWNVWPASYAPFLRHEFITFRFSLTNPIKNWFWLAPDTVAVSMNFLSWIFVLIFWMWLIYQVIDFFHKRKEGSEEDDMTKKITFYSWWTFLLLWLTSGMGAFLVFVDNKTDLGVMAMTILAILSGFIFMKFIKDQSEHWESTHKESIKYAILSWFLFTMAIMSKPTAFVDIAIFGILILALRIDEIMALWIWIMTMWMTWIVWMGRGVLSAHQWKYFALAWLIIVIIWFILMIFKKKDGQFWKNKKRLFKYIMVWFLAILISFFILKWPNYLIRDINSWNFNVWSFMKWLLTINITPQKDILLATTNDINKLYEQNTVDQEALDNVPISLDSCKSQTFSKEELEKNLKKAIVWDEDVWRYVWYGWKEIDKWKWLSIWYWLLKIFYQKDNTCYGLDNGAKLLCNNRQAVDSFDISFLKSILPKVSTKSKLYQILSGAINTYESKAISWTLNPTEFRDQIVSLRQYYQNNSTRVEAWKIFIPYKSLVLFNVIFNRSLQNLSSYYTDIWFIWLFALLFITIWFIYWLFKKDKNLILLSWATIIGRWIWWIIWWWIVWYGIGLIMRTILSLWLFIKDLIDNINDEKEKIMVYIILFMFVIRCIIQFVLNFIRISSQWASWPFIRYQMNNWKEITFNDNLQQAQTVKIWYKQKDVFDLQFPHYNKFIEATKNRKNSEWVLIAWTYLQYFLDNQHNILADGMLNTFRELTSDNNSCKSYRRIKNKKLEYLVIDPNIWTVVMWEWNESLFNRFFAKRDPVTGKIQEHWAITMLVKLWKDGYINLFSTNNLGAKYAFELSDNDLRKTFWNVSEDELSFIRAKLPIPRYFWDSQQLIDFIMNTFSQRVDDWKAIGDIADVYWKTIDQEKLYKIAQSLISQQYNNQEIQIQIKELNQDERLIVTQYVWLYNLKKSQSPQYQEFANSIIWQSIGWGSQLMVFQLK